MNVVELEDEYAGKSMDQKAEQRGVAEKEMCFKHLHK